MVSDQSANILMLWQPCVYPSKEVVINDGFSPTGFQDG